MNIVIIDHDTATASMIYHSCQNSGHKAFICRNQLHAEGLIKHAQPSLVLLNLNIDPGSFDSLITRLQGLFSHNGPSTTAYIAVYQAGLSPITLSRVLALKVDHAFPTPPKQEEELHMLIEQVKRKTGNCGLADINATKNIVRML